ncbi:hypothetical protein LV84_00834 [Algoriphagus ratkowskyi]|uniref:Uncharacterized protein n=2 Tax=Algoriphagus ratkowskyi TaxID=57028 RepID=A0A2W7RKY3_9BACT|nr:hypothetical protein [Algoriphagus ratkowskyi]PZX59626.1 hypothetical protein LV84_00834 [Algoriphagus ratkowskyi]TXD78652.1 hypothetical protein ESW18_07635 [Algoriphagus ratkowskyi]
MSGVSSFKNLQSSHLVNELISYLETELPNFTVSEEFVEILAVKKNENQHSSAFCVYMTNECSSHFYFLPENSQKGSSKIDIGIYKGANLFFTIEAKVLPTPKGPKREEYEYVFGKGGGIERFRKEDHGVDNKNNLLPENGMIAYVKTDDFNYWFSTINQWITDASWPEEEKLEIISFDKIARLKSNHLRKGGSQVILHHFWVDVS